MRQFSKRLSRRISKTKTKTRKWSQYVTQTSNALVLEKGLFTNKDPKYIAYKIYLASRHSKYPLKSGLSMLSFYINRAGKKLSPTQKNIIINAKKELKNFFV